jgi:hypothetical protein
LTPAPSDGMDKKDVCVIVIEGISAWLKISAEEDSRTLSWYYPGDFDRLVSRF